MNQLQELDFNLIKDVEKAIQEQEEEVAKSTEDKNEKEKLSNLNDLKYEFCLLYTSPSPRDRTRSRMPSSA